MDLVLLSRIQFAVTLMFHYLFPPLTIGLGVVLVYLEARHYFSGEEIYHRAAKFWTSLFGLNFAIGVASGIVMEFQFGTNWANYSRFVGDVFGSALAAEGIFAFFLESGFLAILLFGWDKVSKGMHLFATCMVALGSIFSSIWIVVANSWQQTPAGHHIVPVMRDGMPFFSKGVPVMRAEIVDFWALLFNPSSMIRLIHVLIGCFIVGALFVLSISAWYMLKGRHPEFAKRSFNGALYFLLVFSIAAPITGHFHADEVYRYQPAKLAAFEGHFKSGRADLTLFGIPRPDLERIQYRAAIPGGLSFLLFGSFSTPIEGLDKFRKQDRPPVLIPFLSWRIMIGFGVFFVAIGLLAAWYSRRGMLFQKRWLLWVFTLAIVPGVIANQAGWVAAEVGRQPWVVHPPVEWNAAGSLVTGADGLVHYDEGRGLRTRRGVSDNVPPQSVLTSLIGFCAIYLLLGILWLFTLDRKIRQGPDDTSSRKEFRHEAEIMDALSRS